MVLLGIETSCDETSLALIETAPERAGSVSVLGHVVLSQAALHKEYGGVLPNLAKREHAAHLVPLLRQLLAQSGITARAPAPLTSERKEALARLLEHEPGLCEKMTALFTATGAPAIDSIAVTEGPGLEPALWVGISFAKALDLAWDIPVMPINHMEGHIIGALFVPAGEKRRTLSAVSFPAVALLISGGHTELVLMKGWGRYELVGETRDDAVGEAFDKVARTLGLPYPGGPEISRYAEHARAREADRVHAATPEITLPRPMIGSDDFDFSFSGLKTAVLYLVKKIGTLNEETKERIAREFEDAAAEVLSRKTEKAIDHYGARTLIVGGGVIANAHIRRELRKIAETRPDFSLYMSDQELSTDNALMIALAATLHTKKAPSFASEEIRANGNLKLHA